MEKEFIKYEQALALQELEFDEMCFGYYKDKKLSGVNKWDRQDWEFHVLKNKDITNLTSEIILAPLYQQSFRWFREKYGYNGFIYQPNETGYWGHSLENKVKYNSYEEAELACLDTLIEIVKNK